MVKETGCPVCCNKLDAATAMHEPAEPTPGDLTVCIYCASFLQFTDDLDVRPLTESQVGELPDYARIDLQRVRRAILATRKP